MEGGFARMAWVCAPPLRPVDHSHPSNYTLVGAHGSSSSCPLYPGSFIQAGRSLCSGMEARSSADKLTSFSAPRCILSSNAWVSSSTLHISHRRISSQKDSSSKKKGKKKIRRALGHYFNCKYIT